MELSIFNTEVSVFGAEVSVLNTELSLFNSEVSVNSIWKCPYSVEFRVCEVNLEMSDLDEKCSLSEKFLKEIVNLMASQELELHKNINS